MGDVTVRATPNGPYIVQGPIELLDTAGDKYTLDKENIALCRCGHSENKPSRLSAKDRKHRAMRGFDDAPSQAEGL